MSNEVTDGEKTQICSRVVALPTTEDCQALGAQVGACLQPGDFVALYGPVGAGKTTFVQGMARGIGSDQRATSPSFVLMHCYGGTPRLLHADIYRLNSPEEAEDLHLDEWAELQDAAVVVEWADRCYRILPGERLDVHLAFAQPGRRVRLVAHGLRGEALLACVGEPCGGPGV